MDQIEKLKFIKELESDIERLTNQLKFLNDLDSQIGGAKKGNTKKPSPKKEETSKDQIDLVDSQISSVKNSSLLETVSKSIGDDLVKKLTSLRDEIKKALAKSDSKGSVEKVLKSFDNTIKCLQKK